MKKLIKQNGLIGMLLMAFMLSLLGACSQESTDANGVNKLTKNVKDTASIIHVNGTTLKKVTLTDKELKNRTGGTTGGCATGDCCCTCTGTFTINVVNGSEWSLVMAASCYNDYNGFINNPDQQVFFKHNPVSTPYTFTFPIIDEHYYWLFLVSNGCTIEYIINDPSGFSYTGLIYGSSGRDGMAVFQLNCDNISFTNCWSGDNRYCCIQ